MTDERFKIVNNYYKGEVVVDTKINPVIDHKIMENIIAENGNYFTLVELLNKYDNLIKDYEEGLGMSKKYKMEGEWGNISIREDKMLLTPKMVQDKLNKYYYTNLELERKVEELKKENRQLKGWLGSSLHWTFVELLNDKNYYKEEVDRLNNEIDILQHEIVENLNEEK